MADPKYLLPKAQQRAKRGVTRVQLAAEDLIDFCDWGEPTLDEFTRRRDVEKYVDRLNEQIKDLARFSGEISRAIGGRRWITTAMFIGDAESEND